MMVLATDYPFLSILWTMFIVFAWIIWFWLLIAVFSDVFRRHDIGGGAKVLWLIFVIVLPFLGVFIYLITQSQHMAERNEKQMRAMRSSGGAAEIEKAKQLLDSGAITQAEYDALKQQALA
jgi:uncharacterized membrane protein